MVGALKKWLGIKALEDESLILAKTLKAHIERMDAIEAHFISECEQIVKSIAETKELTSEPAKPKIVPKQRVNWKNFRSAAEKASEPEREEA